MNSNKKNNAKEPTAAYKVTPKVNSNEEALHPILVQLLEKSIQEAEDGKTYTHEEVMRMTKERYPFLK